MPYLDFLEVLGMPFRGRNDPAEMLGAFFEKGQPFVEKLLDTPMDILGSVGERTIEPTARGIKKVLKDPAEALGAGVENLLGRPISAAGNFTMGAADKFLGGFDTDAPRYDESGQQIGTGQETPGYLQRFGGSLKRLPQNIKNMVINPQQYPASNPFLKMGLTPLNAALAGQGKGALWGSRLGGAAGLGLSAASQHIPEDMPILGPLAQLAGRFNPADAAQMGATAGGALGAGAPYMLQGAGKAQRGLESIPYLGRAARYGTLPGLMGLGKYGASGGQDDPLDAQEVIQRQGFERELASRLEGLQPGSSAYENTRREMENQFALQQRAMRQQYGQQQQQLDMAREGQQQQQGMMQAGQMAGMQEQFAPQSMMDRMTPIGNLGLGAGQAGLTALGAWAGGPGGAMGTAALIDFLKKSKAKTQKPGTQAQVSNKTGSEGRMSPQQLLGRLGVGPLGSMYKNLSGGM